MAKAVVQTKEVKKEGSKISSVLITLPKPDSEKSPYFDLAKKYSLQLDFFPFIRIEGMPGKDFKKQKVDIAEHTAIIFTSRNAVEHFFRICDEIKVKISQDMKYFCISEAVALYLQKFILYRKRKVFFSPDGTTEGLLEVIAKHKHQEKYILPTADNGKTDINKFLSTQNIPFSEATLYRTVSNDISELMEAKYDVIAFFSPLSLGTLFEYFPDFQQNGTRLGAFGPSTAKAVEDAGLTLNVSAPAPGAPSMVAALDKFIEENHRKKK
jgi:uroporphyrinogen-III synthase